MPKITEVFDRKLPDHEDLLKESKRSQAKGATGAGHNKQSHNESMADNGQGVEIEETFSKTRAKGTLPTPSQFTPWRPAE